MKLNGRYHLDLLGDIPRVDRLAVLAVAEPAVGFGLDAVVDHPHRAVAHRHVEAHRHGGAAENVKHYVAGRVLHRREVLGARRLGSCFGDPTGDVLIVAHHRTFVLTGVHAVFVIVRDQLLLAQEIGLAGAVGDI